MFRSMIPFGRRADLARSDDPFLAFQREMNRLFDATMGGYPTPGNGAQLLAPSLDVKETDKAIEVEAELPGVDEKDIQVTLDNDMLTIKGEKKAQKEESKKDYYMSERSYGSFLRSLQLPAGVDAGKVNATFSKGVLKVVLPKPAGAEVKAKKIDVKVG